MQTRIGTQLIIASGLVTALNIGALAWTSLRAYLAESLVAAGRRDDALPLVAKTADVSSSFGSWWTLRGMLHPDTAAESFPIGASLDPLRPLVACEAKPPPDKPADPLRAVLCEAARRVPVAR